MPIPFIELAVGCLALLITAVSAFVFGIKQGRAQQTILDNQLRTAEQQQHHQELHSIQQRPVAVDKQVVIRPMMNLALSYDHRVVDGKEAVTFLIRVKDCIENPARMLVGA